MFHAESTAHLTDDQLRRRLDQLNRLVEVTRVLAAELDTREVLRTIITEACHAIEAERASLYQYDPKRRELYTTVVTELEIGEIRKGIDQGISGYVARERKMVNIPDPARDPRWSPAIDQATGFHTRNILAAPLISPHDDALLGVLSLLNNAGGPFDDVDEHLMVAFSQHAAVALDRARLMDEIQRRQVIEASLGVAREIQRRFMPSVMPTIAGYESGLWWFPQQAVGGDYCDLLPLPDGRFALCIADVSGHGLGPSLIMASVRAALRALLIEHHEPELLLDRLSQSLAEDLAHGLFITIILGMLDPVRHEFVYANAGHGPALHYRAADGAFAELESTGFPLGILDRAECPQAPPRAVAAGDLLVLCTDGIVEAMDAHDRQFGVARLEDLIRQHAREPVSEICQQVGRAVESHYSGQDPDDDLTVMIVRRVAS